MDLSPRRRGGYADAVVSAAVLFDLDGTLIDRRAAVVALRTSLEYSRSIDSAELPNLELRWFSLERSHMDVFLAGECTFVEQRRRRLVSSYQRWVSPLLATVNLTRGWAGRSAGHQQ